MILAVNTSFPELDHLAAGLAEAGILHAYLRPYACHERFWERTLRQIPRLKKICRWTIDRRRLPEPLSAGHVRHAAVLSDLALAVACRRPLSRLLGQGLPERLIHARTLGVAHAAATRLSGEQAVVASWGCAAEVFLAMKRRGGLCVLSYPLAHHAAALGILEQEACSNPDFAPTLAGQTWPGWLVDRWEAEIAMADRILVGSSYVRQTFLEQDVPAEKLVVVPYGVDHRFWTPSLSGSRVKQPLQLLFVGQLSQRKGISSLLEAVEALGPNRVELTAVGRLKGDWSTLSAARRLFRHIGHLPRAELLTIYRQAEVFVLPSLVEGMPLAVLEAMACGLPVLTTPNGAGDVVRDGLDGLILPPGDTGRLIAGLESLEAAPARRLSMGHNARGRALQFSWQRYRQCACDHLRKWLGHSVFREAEWPDDDLRLKHERSLGP